MNTQTDMSGGEQLLQQIDLVEADVVIVENAVIVAEQNSLRRTIRVEPAVCKMGMNSKSVP